MPTAACVRRAWNPAAIATPLHALDLDADVRSISGNRLEVSRHAIETSKSPAGVRNMQRRHRGLGSQSWVLTQIIELGWKLVGADWSVNALWQVARFRATRGRRGSVCGAIAFALDVTADGPLKPSASRCALQWPLRQSLAAGDL